MSNYHIQVVVAGVVVTEAFSFVEPVLFTGCRTKMRSTSGPAAPPPQTVSLPKLDLDKAGPAPGGFGPLKGAFESNFVSVSFQKLNLEKQAQPLGALDF